MPTIEVSLPEDLHMQFERVIDDEFVTQEEAVEELLAAGLDAYATDIDAEDESTFADEYADEMWDTAGNPTDDERP